MTFTNINVPDDNQEGTTMKIKTWLKSIGDVVVKDEPLIEIETDKVTMEIEAPSDGILSEILAKPGADVLPGALIGKLSANQETANTNPNPNDLDVMPNKPPRGERARTQEKEGGLAQPLARSSRKFSPAVRRFVSQYGLDVTGLIGSGKGGRLTLQDVKISYENTHALAAVNQNQQASPVVSTSPLLTDHSVPHSNMRRAIAKHMSHSVTTAPHVTAVFELDFSAIAAHRAAHKSDFANQGVKLTYSAYFVMACVQAMKAVPSVNSQWRDDEIFISGDVNIGIGTSLGDQGLVVPVLKQAQSKNLLEVAAGLQDITGRARENKLKPSDLKGGTFSISNHGVSGSLVAAPIIINQPQSAILGVGKLEKRVVVNTMNGQDVIAIKPMAFVSLTIDHRVLDGHQTNQWLTRFVETLENWTEKNDWP